MTGFFVPSSPFGALLAELDLRFGFSLISLSFSQSLSSQILVNGINLVSPLMSWSRRYRVNSYIRSSVWIIPLVAAVVEQAAAALAHMLDARLAGQATFSFWCSSYYLSSFILAIFSVSSAAEPSFRGNLYGRTWCRRIFPRRIPQRDARSARARHRRAMWVQPSFLPPKAFFSDPKIMITLVASAIFADRASPCRALAAAKSAGSSTRNGDPKSAQ
jgi:hypothetical protein